MAEYRGIDQHNGGIRIRLQYRGVRYQEFINKPWNPTNCAEAVRRRKQFKKELAEGRITPDHLSEENPIFVKVAQDYIDHLRGLDKSESYINTVKRDLNNIWIPILGTMPIKNIQPRDVRLADNREWSSAKRRQNARSVLRGVFALAIQDDYIDADPCAKGLKSVEHQQAQIDPFDFAEKVAILNTLKESDEDSWFYYLLAFDIGLRSAEILGLEPQDFRGDYLHLERTMVLGKIKSMKIKEARQVYLTDDIKNAWEDRPRPIDGIIFRNTEGGRIRKNRDYVANFNAALEQNGIRYRRSYNARHTRASLGLSVGQTPAWLAAQMGHDLRTFFQRYAKFIGHGDDRAEMEKLQSWQKVVLKGAKHA